MEDKKQKTQTLSLTFGQLQPRLLTISPSTTWNLQNAAQRRTRSPRLVALGMSPLLVPAGTGSGVGPTLGVGRWPRLPTPPPRLEDAQDAQGNIGNGNHSRLCVTPGRVTQKPVQTRRTLGTPENSMMESHRRRATAASHPRSAPNLSSGRRSDRKRSSKSAKPRSPLF